MIDILTDQRFGASHGGRLCLDANWAAAEQDFTWSLGTESLLSLELPPNSSDLLLELVVQPFTAPPALVAQTLFLSANAMPLGNHLVEGRQTLSLSIPNACINGADALILRLHCPHAAAPEEFGLGADRRQLGIRLYRATLLHVPPVHRPPPLPGADHLELDATFGWGGTGNMLLLDGWSAPEHDYHWAVGRHSRLRVPINDPPGTYTLLLDVRPIGDDRLKQQRIVVGANNRLISMLAVSTRTILTLPLPRLEPGMTDILLTFDNLDAATGRQFALYADGRPFAFMLLGLRLIRRATTPSPLPPPRAPLTGAGAVLAEAAAAVAGLSPRELAARFDTLGHGCTLTQFQLDKGVDRITLLRYTGINAVALVRALADGFDQLGRPDRIETVTYDWDDRLWMLETRHQLRFRSPWPVGGATIPGTIARDTARRLLFLRRRFLEDLAEPGRIYVFMLQPATQMEAEAVAAMLRLYGPHTMLWLVQDGPVAPGAVTPLAPGLLLGRLDRGPDGVSISHDVWLSVLANAWAISREWQRSAHAPAPDPPAY
jgi:hypothetical protein